MEPRWEVPYKQYREQKIPPVSSVWRNRKEQAAVDCQALRTLHPADLAPGCGAGPELEHYLMGSDHIERRSAWSTPRAHPWDHDEERILL